jgi:cytochrome P450
MFKFTAAFATIPVAVHVLLNLFGLEEAQAFLPLLREEIQTTFLNSEDWEDPNATAPGRMPLLEAFLRESMRHTPFFTRGQEHKVIARNGIELPDGTHVPTGTFLACPVAGIAGDERFYPEPHLFDPFRFLDEVPSPGEGAAGKSYVLKPNCQLTSPSDTFLGFGYGRRAW